MATTKRTQALIDLSYAVSRETQSLASRLTDVDTIGVLVHSYRSHGVLVYGTPHAVQVASATLARHGYHVSPSRLLKRDARRVSAPADVAVVYVQRRPAC